MSQNESNGPVFDSAEPLQNALRYDKCLSPICVEIIILCLRHFKDILIQIIVPFLVLDHGHAQ